MHIKPVFAAVTPAKGSSEGENVYSSVKGSRAFNAFQNHRLHDAIASTTLTLSAAYCTWGLKVGGINAGPRASHSQLVAPHMRPAHQARRQHLHQQKA